MGHDAINCWVVIGAECERLGCPSKCEHCDGHGYTWPSDEARKLNDDWKCTEPPLGDGYQLWETVSEGSPISPVFDTPEALATWLTTSPDYKWKRNDAGTTWFQWVNFIKGSGWAPSGVMKDGAYVTGVQASM